MTSTSLSGRKSERKADPKIANSEIFQRLQNSAIFALGTLIFNSSMPELQQILRSRSDPTSYLLAEKAERVIIPPIEIGCSVDMRRRYERSTKALRTYLLREPNPYPYRWHQRPHPASLKSDIQTLKIIQRLLVVFGEGAPKGRRGLLRPKSEELVK